MSRVKDVAERRAVPSHGAGPPSAASRRRARLSRRLPIASEGWVFILVPLAVALLLAWAGWLKVAVLPSLVAAFMAFFFRDPDRTPSAVPGAILAPADGRVTEVREDVEDAFVGRARQVSIFLSPLDVHVNRASIGGRVVSVEHRPGRFLPAYKSEAGQNERVTLALEGPSGRVVMRQIVGVLARRIVCRVRPGDRLEVGERFGMIKFGSRMDVVMPARARLVVRRGDRVRAGETILGVLE
ncbi:MAG: phosphatidylserine decarboxylase [Candidatus Rokubacteria bacterium]|nr:phosphatidylserine decarboxylase [Candidatus Rokubacteria bacterium]